MPPEFLQQLCEWGSAADVRQNREAHRRFGGYHSVPAVLYLVLKYHRDPEKALVVNTNLGGDNVYRGALLGAQNGLEKFPRRWIEGLLNPPPELAMPSY